MEGEICTTGAPRRSAGWGRAIRVAMVVGPVLFLVNHFDHLAHGRWPPDAGTKLILTFLVPFGVSLYSSSPAARTAAPGGEPTAGEGPPR